MVKKILRRIAPWAKRAGALISVIMVLCCCMIPVSAADVGFGSEREYHSIIDFDFIYGASFYSDEVAYLDWQLNYFRGDSRVSATQTVSNGAYGYDASSLILDDRFSSELAFASPMNDFLYLELFAFDVLMSRDDLVNKHGFIDFGLDGGASFDASVSFRAWTYKLIGETYFLSYKDFSSTFSTQGDKSFDFIQVINQTLTDSTFRSTDYVYLTDLRITFTDIRAADSSNIMIYETDTMAARPIMQSFVTDSKLMCDVTVEKVQLPSDWTTWLFDSAAGFLNFEIFPGFSFGVLLSAILGVLILLTILQLLR